MTKPVSFLGHISNNIPVVKTGGLSLCSEERLWREVVLQTARDFDLKVWKIKALVEVIGMAPHNFRVDLQEIINETKTDWFDDICEWANTSPARVRNHLEDKWVNEYNVDQFPFRNKADCIVEAKKLIERDPGKAKTALTNLGVYIYYKNIFG